MDWRASTVDPPRAGDFFQEDSRLHEARNFLSVPPAMEISHSVAMGEAPLAEVGTSQELRAPPMEFIAMQSWLRRPPLDISTVQYSQSLTVTEHGGLRDERVQRYGEQELHSEIPEADNTSMMQEYDHSVGTSFLGTARQGEVLTYPEGEAGAVRITERDMEGLRPTEYLGNNIIDFYIRYLESTLSLEERGRFHFFNSFFFTKLLGSNSASYNVDECKVDYEHVRKWTREVNLFEKDYIFIPVIKSSHWSLIIICHLRSVWSASDEKKGSPCILHLDPAAGVHESFKRLVRSYISKAWKVKHPASDDMDQLSDLFQMKYIRAEVPRQDNGYDCGLYLLHYIVQSLCASPPHRVSAFYHKKEFHFLAVHILHKKFLSNAWLSETSSLDSKKRIWSNTVPMFDAHRHVSKHPLYVAPVVLNNYKQPLLGTHQTDNRTSCELALNTKALNGVAVGHEEYPWIGEVPMAKNQQVRKRPRATLPELSKVSKKRIWTVEETQTLLKCKAGSGDHFSMKNQTGMNWDSVSLEISKNTVGTTPSAEQCRRRYETLQKAYKSMKDYCAKTGRTFSEITEEERVGLKLATTLNEEWYKCIDAFSHKVKPHKRARDSGGDGTGQASAGNVNHSAPVGSAVPAPGAMTTPISPPAPIPTGNSSREHFAIPGFKSLEEDLRSTLLDLMMFLRIDEDTVYNFEETCRKVGIVQDRKPSDIRNHVIQLSALKLVNFECEDGTPGLNLEEMRVYKKFVKKVLRKNPDFDICLSMLGSKDIVSVPKAPVSLSVQRIRVLVLWQCGNLQCVDLSFFPELRYLDIRCCSKLEKVTGWEAVKELGYLKIRDCDSYKDFPPVQKLPALAEFKVSGIEMELSLVPALREFEVGSGIEISSVPGFSQCVRLRRLQIWGNKSWALNSMDLSTLRFLEVLELCHCHALTTIQGLSGLHSLTTLNLSRCKALRRVPELGCLKGLTQLDVSYSGVEEISGVQELHLLTSLVLYECRSLKTLPWLGHLKALTSLDISYGGVEEIPGVQDLISLEGLWCVGSSLKWLPDLHHLPRLQWVWIHDTPLSTTESPSSFYYGKGEMDYNCERKDFDDDISDFSDISDSDISDISY